MNFNTYSAMRTAPLKKKKVQVLKDQGPLCHLIKLEVSYMTFSLKLGPPLHILFA